MWIYITLESPLSGMSMNPARTMGSALMAADFRGLWITSPHRPSECCWPPNSSCAATGCTRSRAPSCITCTPARVNFRLLDETATIRGHQSVMTHYDVIIIGTGAGGGDTRPPARGSGKRILLLGAATTSVARRTTGVHAPSTWTRSITPPRRGARQDGAAASAHALPRRRQYEVLRRSALFRLRKEDRRASAPRRVSPAWPHQL